MPLPERVVQPVNVSRGTLSYAVPDELEGVTNGTLANIIRQLSSLSRHAEEMFGNLFTEAEVVAARSSSLQAKIDKLAIRVTQLDSTVEEVSLQDIQLRKAFRSSQAFDQQVVSRDTMPKAMLEAYMACDKPPPLDKLNPYRDDGKDGLKFYTDPGYFFELWRQDMLKDTEKMMHDRGKKPGKSGSGGQKRDDGRHKKRPRQPHNTAERQKQKMVGRGEFIIDQTNTMPGDNTSYQDSGYASTAAAGGNGIHHNDQMPNSNGNNYSPDPLLNLQRPNSIEVNRAYEQQLQQQQQQQQQMQQRMASVNLNTNGNAVGYQQEPIYTPHVLRGSGDEPPSQRYNPQSISSQHYPPTAMFGRTQDNMDSHQQQPFNSHPFLDATPATTAAAAQQQQLNQQPQLQQFNPGYQFQNQQSQNQPYQQNQSPVGTPTKANGGQRRPSQPPPAPPPGGTLSPTPSAGTPTRNGGSRGNSTQRDSLPPPPPPPGITSTPVTGSTTLSETQQQLHHNLMNGLQNQFNNASNSPPKHVGGSINATNLQNNFNNSINHNVSNSTANHSASSITHDDSLPPPPPVPDAAGIVNSANNSLNVKMNNLEHLLPPSPPPPPAPSSNIPASSSSSIPPPPPPPPSDLNSNGLILNNHTKNINGDVNNKTGAGSPLKNSILSPPGLKKPAQPNHLKAQDGVRSDLLKAIRDGIALKKVEQRQQAKEAEKEAASGQTDVATILARRVAVEMSDSEGGGPSDSEYDSDDWGDESTA